MLKQVGNRVSGLGSVTRRRLYHYNNPLSFDKKDPTGLVWAPTCEDVMKTQIKIDDKMRKMVDDYFKAGTPCKTLVGVQPNAKIKVDDRTGKIVDVVGFESTVCSASSYFNTGDSKTSLSLPPVKLQYCSMLAEDAIKAAIKDYEVNKAKFSDHSGNA